MNRKANVYILCVVVFLQGLVFYGPVAALYRQSRGLSMYEIFVIESIFMVLMLLFEVPWGWFADRFGYKFTLIIANLFLFISKIVFYNANSFSLFLLERILMAMAFSGISGCDIALLYSSIDDKKSEKVFGLYNASSSAGLFAASLVSGAIVVKSMSLSAFYTIIPYGIALVLSLFIIDVKHAASERHGFKDSIKDILSNKRVLLIVAASALSSEVSHSIGVFLNQVQYIKAGIGIGYFGLLTALMQGVSMLSAKTYKFSMRFGQANVVRVPVISILLGCVMLAITWNPWVTIAMVALIQCSSSIIQPVVLDNENKAITSHNRATILSVYAMSGDIIASVVNLAIGKAADISVETSFLVCGGISGLALALAWIYFSKRNAVSGEKQ